MKKRRRKQLRYSTTFFWILAVISSLIVSGCWNSTQAFKSNTKTSPQDLSNNRNDMNSLDDLLAVENVRWLQIGKQQADISKEPQPANLSTLSAPYESNLTASNSNSHQLRPNLVPLQPVLLQAPVQSSLNNGHQPPPPWIWPHLASFDPWHPLAWFHVEPRNQSDPSAAPNTNNRTEHPKQSANKSESSEDKSAKSPFEFTTDFPSLTTNSNDEDRFEARVKDISHKPAPTRTNSTRLTAPKIDELDPNLESFMVTNRSMVSLQCDKNHMFVQLNFREPFYGRIQTNIDQASSCFIWGHGNRSINWRIGLYDCGTRQEIPRVFINNLQIQFIDHKASSKTSRLDIDQAEEIKTIVCSYPLKPIAQQPNDLISWIPNTKNVSDRIVQQLFKPGAGTGSPAQLVEYDPLLIVAGFVLMSLAILIFGLSGFVLKQRLKGGQRQRRSAKFDDSWKSLDSTRLYKTSPSLVANQHLSDLDLTGKPSNFIRPPLLSWSRRGGRQTWMPRVRNGIHVSHPMSSSRSKRAKQHSKFPQTKSRTHPRAQKSGTKEARYEKRDSLGESSSVTMIEIPHMSPQADVRDERKSPDSPHPKDPNLHQGHDQQIIENTGQVDELQDNVAGSTEMIKKPETKAKAKTVVQVNKETEDVTRLGSIRKTLTSPTEFRRLKQIERLFAVDTSQLSSLTKKQQEIMQLMKPDEYNLVRDKLKSDELFRSHVIQSKDPESFDKKLRQNPKYRQNFKPETWDLLENILIGPSKINAETPKDLDDYSKNTNNHRDLNGNEQAGNHIQTKLRDQRPTMPTQLAQSSSRNSTYNKRLRDSELEHDPIIDPIDDRPADREEKLVQTNCDSLEESIKSTISIDYDTKQQRNKTVSESSSSSGDKSRGFRGLGEYLEMDMKLTNTDRERGPSLVRVSQYSSSKTRNQRGHGLSGTVIEIDSVTSITSGDDFRAYAKSSIEHKKYQDRYDDNSPTSSMSIKLSDSDDTIR